MSGELRIVKLGGDALATPERIAAQARRLVRWSATGPLIAVVSARRGVTDQLLQLAGEVQRATASSPRLNAPRAKAIAAEADRATAAGEVVSAALLALALSELGVAAVSLDAREAGIGVRGSHAAGTIDTISAGRLRRLLQRGLIPVVTGFQGWKRGRVVTLERGGTDTSAVALAVALKADRVLLVKEAPGLRTADPRLVPDAQQIREAPHHFLSAICEAGSKVVQADAARLAERHGIPLEFWSLDGESPETLVHGRASDAGLRALATLVTDEHGHITVVSDRDLEAELPALQAALAAANITQALSQLAAGAIRFVVPAALAGQATSVLHAALTRVNDASVRRAS